jgi:hypothetical protein
MRIAIFSYNLCHSQSIQTVNKPGVIQSNDQEKLHFINPGFEKLGGLS